MIRIPILRPGSDAAFPPVERALREPNGLLAAGGDLGVPRLLEAYRHGIFPWYSEGEPILWWAPDPRMVFQPAQMHVPQRLRRWLRGCEWTVRADVDFAGVMAACAAPRPGQHGTWITRAMSLAYRRLHELGHAHSIEVYAGDERVGGLYGVAMGEMFYAESMYSAATNGSKVALLGLARRLRDWGWLLIDAQVSSDHLFTLGGREMPRAEFARTVHELVERPATPIHWRERFGSLAAGDLLG